MQREVLSNWQGARCPACGAKLRYASDLPGGDGKTVLVLLRCEGEHCWEERLSLATTESDVFVERRLELERSRSPR